MVRDTAKYLGMAAANLVVIADPEMLVLGGIMASAADLLLEPVRTELARRLPQAMMDALAIDTAVARRRRGGDRRGASRQRGAAMIVLSGASLVLPDRILSPGTLVIEDGRIADIRPDAPSGSHPESHFAFHGHYIVPGFIDVHVHGVDGIDSLDSRPDGGDAVARDGRAAAAIRRDRVLPDDRRVRAGRTATRARSGPPRARNAVGARCARPAGASREQLHQPRISGRAARGVLAQAAGCAWSGLPP